MTVAETTDYDPRYDRAQTVVGAQARYVSCPGYSLSDLEDDLDRVLQQGRHPDRGGYGFIRPSAEGER